MGKLMVPYDLLIFLIYLIKYLIKNVAVQLIYNRKTQINMDP